MIRTATVVALVIGASTGAASADPIHIAQTQAIFGHASFQDSNGLGFTDFFGKGDSDGGTFVATDGVSIDSAGGSVALTASQATTITPTHFFGTGSVGAHAEGEFGELILTTTVSDFNVLFDLAHAMSYHFKGTLSSGGGDLAGAQSALEGVFNEGTFGGPTIVAEHSGILMPGRYLFFATAKTNESIATLDGAGAFNVDFTLSAAPTPEPMTLLLLGAGVSVIVAKRSTGRSRDDRQR